MKITEILIKKEKMKNLFPLEGFMEFDGLLPLSWKEVLENEFVKDIDNNKFNLNGTIKDEYKEDITPKELRDYWLNRLSYFTNEASIVNNDYDEHCVIELKENVNNDWLISSGVESLAFAIKNDKPLYISGDEKNALKIVSQKLIGEEKEEKLISYWDFKSVDLNDIKFSTAAINSSVGYDADWLNNANNKTLHKLITDEVKYYLSLNLNEKEFIRKEIFNHKFFFSLLNTFVEEIQNQNDGEFLEKKELYTKFFIDIISVVIDEKFEKNHSSVNIIKFITNICVPTMNVRNKENILSKISDSNDFVFEKNQLSQINEKNGLTDFLIKFNEQNDEDILNIWKLMLNNPKLNDLFKTHISNLLLESTRDDKILDIKIQEENSFYLPKVNKNTFELFKISKIMKEYFPDKSIIKDVDIALEYFSVLLMEDILTKNSYYENDSLTNIVFALEKIENLDNLSKEEKLNRIIRVNAKIESFLLISNTSSILKNMESLFHK